MSPSGQLTPPGSRRRRSVPCSRTRGPTPRPRAEGSPRRAARGCRRAPRWSPTRPGTEPRSRRGAGRRPPRSGVSSTSAIVRQRSGLDPLHRQVHGVVAHRRVDLDPRGEDRGPGHPEAVRAVGGAGQEGGGGSPGRALAQLPHVRPDRSHLVAHRAEELVALEHLGVERGHLGPRDDRPRRAAPGGPGARPGEAGPEEASCSWLTSLPWRGRSRQGHEASLAGRPSSREAPAWARRTAPCPPRTTPSSPPPRGSGRP